MKCPKCSCEDCAIVSEVSTTGKDFSAGKGCCGAILLGQIGILCGACGKGRQINTTNYWVCKNCGNKFKA